MGQRFVYGWKCKSLYKKKSDASENKLRSAEYSLPCDDDVICIDIRCVTKRLNDSEKNYMKQLQAEKNNKSKKKKKEKEIGETKTVYYIVACSKSTLFVWCLDPLQQHRAEEKEQSLKPVVEMTISDTMITQKQIDSGMDASLSWIRHCQFMNDTTLMVMRGSQSIAVQKQITFVTQEDKNDDGFVGKVVLEQ